jgi:hypothetical protein
VLASYPITGFVQARLHWRKAASQAALISVNSTQIAAQECAKW